MAKRTTICLKPQHSAGRQIILRALLLVLESQKTTLHHYRYYYYYYYYYLQMQCLRSEVTFFPY